MKIDKKKFKLIYDNCIFRSNISLNAGNFKDRIIKIYFQLKYIIMASNPNLIEILIMKSMVFGNILIENTVTYMQNIYIEII